MTKKRWMVAALLLAGVPGCGGAMGMDRGPFEAVAPDQEVQIDDSRIADALARQPQLPDRVRVGVWFRPPADGSWSWTFEDRQRVVRASETVDRVDLFPISRGFVEGTDVVSLRLAAARHGAHALLIVEGRPEQRFSDNAWVATYPLLLPILFAPAQELDTRFALDAQMYDVRNGFLYLTAEAEGLEEQQRAHVWIDRDGGVREARNRAIEYLHAELRDRLAHLVGERDDGPIGRAHQPSGNVSSPRSTIEVL
ncbi:MAG: hypothetical protein H6719_31560 [Sandaracinaceae bacterium]|nr:hypothetical protein [Sandaracinaceae bacterium]